MDDNSTSTSYSSDNSYYGKLDQILNFYLMEIGVPCMSILGIIGNTIGLVAFIRTYIKTSAKVNRSSYRSFKVMERSSNMGFIAQSLSNLAFCILVTLITLLHPDQSMSMAYFYLFVPCLITFFIATSTWITVVMSGERYLAVSNPIKAQQFISLMKTRVTIIVVFALCFLATLPIYFEGCIEVIELSNTTYYVIQQKLSSYRYVMTRRVVWAICFDFLPCVALIYFNSIILFKITQRQVKTRHSSISSPQLLTRNNLNSRSQRTSSCTLFSTDDGFKTNLLRRQETVKPVLYVSRSTQRNRNIRAKKINITLVAIVVLFLVLVAPSEMLKFFYMIVGDGKIGQTHKLNIVKSVTNFMQTTNFAVSFVVYAAFHKK